MIKLQKIPEKIEKKVGNLIKKVPEVTALANKRPSGEKVFVGDENGELCPVPIKDFEDFQKQAKRILPKVTEFAKDNVKKMIGVKALILYCYDPNTVQMDVLPLAKHYSYIVIRRTGELFYLVAPAFRWKDTFVYICVREFPIAVPMKLAGSGYGTVECPDDIVKLKAFVPVGMEAATIKAKLESVYAQRIYRMKQITQVAMFLMLLLPLVAALITYIATISYVNPLPRNNSTISDTLQTLSILWRGF